MTPRATSALGLPLLRVALALFLGFGLPGCKFDRGLTLPFEAGSLGLALFGNETLEPDLERQLHLELSRSAQRIVRAPLVPPSQADLVLEGRILLYRRRGGIRSAQNQLLETGVIIQAEGWLSPRPGAPPRVGPTSVSISVGYTLEDVSSESVQRQRALANLADKLLLDLLARPPSAPADSDVDEAGRPTTRL